MYLRQFLIVLGFSSLFATSGLACGVDTDCPLGDRTYRIQMPDGVERPGAIVYAHGYKGSAVGTMRNRNLRRLADELGVALVAVKSYADDWRIPGVPADPSADGAEERAYFADLLVALREVHGIDTDRLLMTGFSAGGMMTWQLACDMGEAFAGFAPISGTFWAPVPERCAGPPVNLFHTHGTSDKMVPLEGRPIRTTRQGDVAAALDMLKSSGDYAEQARFAENGLDCGRWVAPEGAVVEFCTHPGGHAMKVDYVRRAWMRLRELGAV